MSSSSRYTAFSGTHLLLAGTAPQVGLAIRKALKGETPDPILIFDDQTGRQADFDLRGTDEEIEARFETPDEPPQEAAPKSPGRPKLGVVAKEVTLLPRHWEWLAGQSGGASATLRRLVETARKQDEHKQAAREAQQATDRFMMAMLGNQPGYEEAARALYAGDRARFFTLSDPWPADLRDYARRLAQPAFTNDEAAPTLTPRQPHPPPANKPAPAAPSMLPDE